MRKPVDRSTEERAQGSLLGEAFWLAVLWIFGIALLAATAPLWPLPPYDHVDWEHPAAAPGTRGQITVVDDSGVWQTRDCVHLLGTDTLGRDLLARLIRGGRISLQVGLLTPILGLVVGGLLGMAAGYFRGRVEQGILMLTDAILAFPGMVLLLAVSFYLGSSLGHIICALGLLTIPAFVRVARAGTLKYASMAFVQSARMLGQGHVSILFGEILPNIALSLTVYALLVVSYMIVAEGALSFLGLSVPAPAPSWGGMIAEGKEVLDTHPHVSLLPALALMVTVLAFNLVGDALRGRIDAREGQL